MAGPRGTGNPKAAEIKGAARVGALHSNAVLPSDTFLTHPFLPCYLQTNFMDLSRFGEEHLQPQVPAVF